MYPELNKNVSSSKHITIVCFEQQIVLDILCFDENKQDSTTVDTLNDSYLNNIQHIKSIYRIKTLNYIIVI